MTFIIHVIVYFFIFLFHGPYYKCHCSIQLRLLEASLFNVSAARYMMTLIRVSWLWNFTLALPQSIIILYIHKHPSNIPFAILEPDNRSVSYQRLTSEPSSHISPSIFPNPNCVYMIQRYFKDLPSIPINIRTHPRFELLK